MSKNPIESNRQHTACDHGDDHIRQPAVDLLDHGADHQGGERHGKCVGIEVANGHADRHHGVVEVFGSLDIQPEHMFELTAGDQQGRSGREADDHRMRDEIHQGAQARQTHDKFCQTHEESESDGQGDVLGTAGLRQCGQRGEHHQGGGRGGTGDQMVGGAEQRRDDGRHHGGIQAILRRHAGNGGKRHALGQNHDRTGDSGHEIGLQRIAVNARQPGQKRQKLPQFGKGQSTHGRHSGGAFNGSAKPLAR